MIQTALQQRENWFTQMATTRNSRSVSNAKMRAAQRAARPDRPLAILLAAEKLFATEGYHAVSLRAIADAAGVPVALVDYHFGKKHELFDAIFSRWQGTVDERLAQLAAVPLDASPRMRRQTLRRIVEAFVTPVLRLRASAEGEYYAQLVTRELLTRDTPEIRKILKEHFDPMAHAYIDAIHSLFPEATRGQAAWCYQFALGSLSHHINDARVERLSLQENKAIDPAAAQLLVDFIVGGIFAVLGGAAEKAPLQRVK